MGTYNRTVRYYGLLTILLNWFKLLGRKTCTVHLIFAQTSQKRNHIRTASKPIATLYTFFGQNSANPTIEDTGLRFRDTYSVNLLTRFSSSLLFKLSLSFNGFQETLS